MRTYKDEKLNTLLLLFCVAVSFIMIFICDGFAAADTVREECLRLHVLANTDSEEDQSVKLKVRDAILEETGDMFLSCTTASDAVSKTSEYKEEIEAVAEKVLYENISLPAGNYTALKVVLGEGDGHNWWCVMFPPLCLPAVSESRDDSVYGVFGEKAGNLVTGKSGYKVKFRIVEIVENIIEALKS